MWKCQGLTETYVLLSSCEVEQIFPEKKIDWLWQFELSCVFQIKKFQVWSLSTLFYLL